MSWFRRRRASIDLADADPVVDLRDGHEPSSDLEVTPPASELIAIPTPDALHRTQEALTMLATQSSQLHSYLVQLEHRMDSISELVLDRAAAPTIEELTETRVHSLKVAGELRRLEVNLAARLDAVGSQLRVLQGQPADEVDLRELSPTDTGWPVGRR